MLVIYIAYSGDVHFIFWWCTLYIHVDVHSKCLWCIMYISEIWVQENSYTCIFYNDLKSHKQLEHTSIRLQEWHQSSPLAPRVGGGLNPRSHLFTYVRDHLVWDDSFHCRHEEVNSTVTIHAEEVCFKCCWCTLNILLMYILNVGYVLFTSWWNSFKSWWWTL